VAAKRRARKNSPRLASAKSESVSLHSGIEKFDLERPIRDRAILPDELVQPLTVDDAAAVCVNVGAVILAGGAPSTVTRNRIGSLFTAGPKTRCRSRA
jgi:hypothetical protein